MRLITSIRKAAARAIATGHGLFARESISSGEVVVIKGGYVLTRAQRDQIGALLGPSEIQITEDLFIGPTAAAVSTEQSCRGTADEVADR